MAAGVLFRAIAFSARASSFVHARLFNGRFIVWPQDDVEKELAASLV
jgi:hypothetical protein